MTLQTLTYPVVGATFALYIGIAIASRVDSTNDFYVAGGGIHPIANGMATAADWMSAASFISMAGLIAFMGYGGSVFLMGWTGGYVLLAMLLAPYLRKFGKFTVPEFIGDRYYSKAARIVAVILLIIASITYVIGQMKGIGVAFSRFLEVDYNVGLAIGMAIVFFYAVMGGMKGITYTQIAQYCVLILAYTVPAIFISLNLTDNPFPQLGLGDTLVGTSTYMLDKLDQVVMELGFAEYTTNARLSLTNMFMYTMSLMIGTAGLPHVIMRFFTVPRVSDARWSAGWTLVFIALLYLTAPAVGAMARLNITEMLWPNGTQGEAVSVQTIAEDPNYDWMATWQKTGLLDWEDKNGDGKIQYYNDASEEMQERAEAAGWEGNELTNFNRDILVLANPEIANLPGWVIGLVAAGGLAAALSTAAGLLLAISSAVSHDLVKGAINPNISEKGELLSARIAMAVAIVVATWLGLNPPGFAAQTVALAFGLAAASIFPALMMGIFSKRINNVGAVCGMLSGLIFTLIYIFLHKGRFFIPDTNTFTDADPLLGPIKATSFGAIGAAVNFAVAYIVSGMTKETPQEIKDLVESVRIPRGAGVAVKGH